MEWVMDLIAAQAALASPMMITEVFLELLDLVVEAVLELNILPLRRATTKL
jgi:hypothetical protein